MNETLDKTSDDREVRRRARIDHTVVNQAIGYIITALGLVVGLAWNDAIHALIEHLFPLNENTILAKFAYAFILTLIITLVTLHLVKLQTKDQE